MWIVSLLRVPIGYRYLSRASARRRIDEDIPDKSDLDLKKFQPIALKHAAPMDTCDRLRGLFAAEAFSSSVASSQAFHLRHRVSTFDGAQEAVVLFSDSQLFLTRSQQVFEE